MKILPIYRPVNFKGVYDQNNTGTEVVSKPHIYSCTTDTFYRSSILPSSDSLKIQNEINEKFILKSSDDWKEESANIYNDNLKNFSDDIFEIMQKYSINTPNKILKEFEKTAYMPEQEIEKYSDKFCIWSYRYAVKKKMQIKQEFLQDFLASIVRIKNVGTGDFPLSMEDVKLLLDSKVERINNKHDASNLNKRVKENIEYSQDETKIDEKIVLNDEEMQELKKLARAKEDLPYEELCKKAINIYVGGDYSLKGASENVQKAVLYSLPRYNSTNITHYYDGLNDFEKHPVVRWLCINENSDEFIQKFKKGETYKYNCIQSCSKTGTYCENEFKDSTPEMNVKFIIHPKSETSKARDLGDRKYGDREVLYPANQEFVVLDKELVKYHDEKTDIYRWVIHMQEK